MKKFFTKAAILAFGFGVAMSLTACHSGEGESYDGTPQEEGATSAVTVKKLTVNVVNAKGEAVRGNIAYGLQAKANATTATFQGEDLPNAKLTVTAAQSGYEDATPIDVKFDETNPVKEITVTLPKKSANQYAQTPGTVLNGTNDTENQTDNAINGQNTVVNLEIPANTGANGDGNVGVAGDYSIVVFQPAQGESEDIKADQSEPVEEDVLGIKCNPDGAQFGTENPAKVTVNLPGSSELDVKLVNSENRSETAVINWPNNNDDIAANLTHFSSWLFVVTAKVQSVTYEEINLTTVNKAVTAGTRTNIEYTRKLGFEPAAGFNKTSLVGRYILGLFGVQGRDIKATYRFTPTASGRAELVVKQQVKNITFVSTNSLTKKSQSFTVRVYGAVVPSVTVFPMTHSGGTN